MVDGASPELRALWLLSFAGPLLPPVLPLLERLAGWVRRPQTS